MPAAAKKKAVKGGAPKLELHREPFSAEAQETYGELVVSINPVAHGSLLDAELRVGIEHREQAIAKGTPIEGAIYLPDYERLDPATQDQRWPVHVEELERIGHTLLHLAAEAKRLGILPPAAKQEG